LPAGAFLLTGGYADKGAKRAPRANAKAAPVNNAGAACVRVKQTESPARLWPRVYSQ